MVTIEVCDEQLTELVIAHLKSNLAGLREELASKRGGFFSLDPKEDHKIIKKHIKAFKLILDYYGYPQ